MARFTKIIFILSLLLISNNLNAKNPPPGTGTSDVPANILIMLDNSGSMSSRLSSSTLVLYPIDVATDSKGNVYVLEYGYTRIKVFDSSGNYLRSFGSSGRGCNQWYYAKAFTIYNDTIYLADMYGRRILAMTLYGGCISVSPTTSSLYPESIAVNNSYVFVSGFWNRNRIEKFTRSRLNYIGNQSIPTSQFYNSYGMSFNQAGNRLLIADYNGSKISEFNVLNNGSIQYKGSTQGGYSSSNGRFYRPRDVAYDSNGNIYATDRNQNRLQKFNSNYIYQKKVGKYSRTSAFNGSWGMHIDSSDNIYVADFY